MNSVESTWGDPTERSYCLWPTPDATAAPVCFVIRNPGNLRAAHVVASDRELEAACGFLPSMLRKRANRAGERLGEGVTQVHRDAYEPGWHIVCVTAPVIT